MEFDNSVRLSSNNDGESMTTRASCAKNCGQ